MKNRHSGYVEIKLDHHTNCLDSNSSFKLFCLRIFACFLHCFRIFVSCISCSCARKDQSVKWAKDFRSRKSDGTSCSNTFCDMMIIIISLSGAAFMISYNKEEEQEGVKKIFGIIGIIFVATLLIGLTAISKFCIFVKLPSPSEFIVNTWERIIKTIDNKLTFIQKPNITKNSLESLDQYWDLT